jgi:two-component system response regulator ChvI
MPSVLVVDDEGDILRLIVSYLEKRGIQHAGFSDPVAALGHLQQNRTKYDLVLSDVRMPHMSGLEFIDHVRALNPRVKILLMSAFTVDKDQMHRLHAESKIAEFVQKPFTFSKLGEALDRHLGSGKNGLSLLFF